MERADLDLLANHVEAAGGRLTLLLAQATAGAEPPSLLESALNELRSMLEELHVAYEELRVQNDELLQAQAALERERQRYRDLFEFAPDPYFVTDLHGLIQEANLAAATLLRLRARRLVGKPLAVFVDPSERTRFRTDLLRLRHLGRLEDLALRLRPRKGEPILASVTVEAVRDDQGEPVGLRWLARDVTVQRELERQIRDLNADLERRVVERTQDLERARERLTFLAEASRALSESLDPPRILDVLAQLAVSRLAEWSSVTIQERDGTLSRVALAHRDPAKAELLDVLRDRYAPDSAAARGVPRVLQARQPELYPETPSDLIWDAVRTPEQRAALDRLGVGSLIIVPLVARGRVLGALSLVRSRGSAPFGRDDLALAEELARRSALALDNALLYREAQRAVEARDEFLSVAAHELRNPATSLRGFAQLALRAVERGEQHEGTLRHTLERVDQQAGKLAQLVAQLLDLSRLEGGRLTLDRSWANVPQLVTSAVEVARAMTDVHTITLRVGESIDAFVDPMRLEQVLSNLLDNAIKYSPHGGPIEVEVARAGEQCVAISVRDHGVGIAPEHRPRIFERFYRADHESQLPGMGLGLYIAQQIVELHGGRLEMHFPEDGGTRVVVTLPLRPGQRC